MDVKITCGVCVILMVIYHHQTCTISDLAHSIHFVFLVRIPPTKTVRRKPLPASNACTLCHRRLRAGIIADRCLAKAPALAATVTATATTPPSTATAVAASGVQEDLGLLGRDSGARGSCGDFEAARAAAREAEENYARAGNAGGTLRARRMELSLRGDQAAAVVAPLMHQRCA